MIQFRQAAPCVIFFFFSSSSHLFFEKRTISHSLRFSPCVSFSHCPSGRIKGDGGGREIVPGEEEKQVNVLHARLVMKNRTLLFFFFFFVFPREIPFFFVFHSIPLLPSTRRALRRRHALIAFNADCYLFVLGLMSSHTWWPVSRSYDLLFFIPFLSLLRERERVNVLALSISPLLYSDSIKSFL